MFGQTKVGLFNHITIKIAYGDGGYKVTANRWCLPPFRWKWCVSLENAREILKAWRLDLENSL